MSNTVLKSLNSIDINTLNGVNIDSREFARKILNYPAMMVPSVQETIIKSLIQDMPNGAALIDPFMGASNTLVTGMRYGVDVYGQDINPLSVLISQVKTNVYDIPKLNNSLENVLNNITDDPSSKVDVSFRNINKWFQKNVQVELSKIRRAIQKEKNLYRRKFFWVALAETIRLTSNDRTSTFKMHIRSIEDIQNRNPSPISLFTTNSKRSITDLSQLRKSLQEANLLDKGRYKNKVFIKWGDSKKKVRTNKKYELLVTSPPYGDNQTTVTYGQFSYLPLQWIPVSDIDDSIDIDYLDVIQEIDKRSLGGKSIAEYDKIEDEYFSISKSLREFFNGFSPKEKKKAKKVVVFINDLSVTIDKILEKMKPNSYMAWTIGNRNVNAKEVRNDSILTELMESKGVSLFTKLERDILNKRMPGKNSFSKTMSKEKILVFKVKESAE